MVRRPSFSGGTGADNVSGFERVLGTAASDTLKAGAGAITLSGGAGADTVNTADGESNDMADGGPGVDTCTTDVDDRALDCE